MRSSNFKSTAQIRWLCEIGMTLAKKANDQATLYRLQESIASLDRLDKDLAKSTDQDEYVFIDRQDASPVSDEDDFVLVEPRINGKI